MPALKSVRHFSDLTTTSEIQASLQRDGVVQLTCPEDALGMVKGLLGIEGSVVHTWEHECTITGLHTGCAHMQQVRIGILGLH